jgi:ATP-dependent exoDNAse (exonuclease V) beta subunit
LEGAVKHPSDNASRIRAITEFGSTLLVEAAAGTGKTALMAARVTFMLAEGIAPNRIAAITFTEPAASALAERVHHYIEELLRGECPKPLLAALPKGLSETQAANLRVAAARLDEITVATIHAFCRTIISSYAVEADIDPGARILDGDQQSAAIAEIFERWLKRRLDGTASETDAIAVLSKDNPRKVADTLRELALRRLEFRTAKTLPADLSGRPDTDLTDAIGDFRRWYGSRPQEGKTGELIDDLEQLGRHFEDSFKTPPDFARLWALAHPPRIDRIMYRRNLDLREPRFKSTWQKISGKDEGATLNDEAMAFFAEIKRLYATILGRVGAAVIARLAVELDEFLKDYEEFKRAAAFLDFDGLLERAQRLVTTHEEVRRELGKRYVHILVDEFQDTDPVQSEILFQIAAEETSANWIDNRLRPGALFVVGDPKQSIYRFRGADIDAYQLVRAAIKKRWPDNIIEITANFRSRPGILSHVNASFERPLAGADQPGYVALTPFLDEVKRDIPPVVRFAVDATRDARADELRDSEAEAVALACRRLIGNFEIEEQDGTTRKLRAGDITLLSPTRTELWRYERALEEAGVAIASQAGKGLFRRQETQDLLALARLLADPADTLALGALLRGPFVGLSDEVLLDITAALPSEEDGERTPRLSLYTDPDLIAHALARETLIILRDLRGRALAATPAVLLTEAAERLRLRAILALREPESGGRAIANIEAFIERARTYAGRGLKAFVRDATRDLEQMRAASEGQLDVEGDAINIITLHSAKGLEWPVVIPINMATQPRPRDTFVHRVSDNTLHMMLGDVASPELTDALDREDQMLRREQERLWYVTCTRARELLLIPQLGEAGEKSWARIIDHQFDRLPALQVARLPLMPFETKGAEPANTQSSEVFEAERARIAVASKPLVWVRPSDEDDDRATVIEALVSEPGDAPETEAPIGAGRLRGLVLHKLLEEILTDEVGDDERSLAVRAAKLTEELAVEEEEGVVLADTTEMARCVRQALHLKDIAELRPRLVPEWPIYGLMGSRGTQAIAGRVDAVAIDEGRADIVIDWKSDIAPTETTIAKHRAQLSQYLAVTDTERGALVYLTTGQIRWVTSQDSSTSGLSGRNG